MMPHTGERPLFRTGLFLTIAAANFHSYSPFSKLCAGRRGVQKLLGNDQICIAPEFPLVEPLFKLLVRGLGVQKLKETAKCESPGAGQMARVSWYT